MARSFRIGRMALTMHGGEERGGQGTLGRLSLALLPPRRPPPPSTALIVEERTPADAARERARRALLDAQREMGGLLAGAPAALPAPAAQPVDNLAAQIAQLRTRLGDLEGERGRLRAEIELLRGTLAAAAVRLDQLERRLESSLTRPTEPPPHRETVAEPAASHPIAPTPVGFADAVALAPDAAPAPDAPSTGDAPAIAEDHQRALESRVFAAGNVGALLRIAPPPASGVADLAARLAADPSVDHVEIQSAEADAAVLRITFKLPSRWPALRELLGRALGGELAPGAAGWSENAIHLRPTATERH